jgi:hypothetical protein
MSIPVVCPGCKVRFNVSDKFAGKKGPCPKCKTVILIPEVPKEEIKIHAPEEYSSAGKDQKGRPISKPIARQEVRVKPAVVAGIVGGALTVILLCFALRGVEDKVPLIVVGLAIISPPLAIGGYSVLREQELEAYRGRELWIRAALCGAVYALLWALYIPLHNVGLTGEPWQWLFVGPLFLGIGAGAAFLAFALDLTSGALHYSFFLLVTLLLRFAIGLPPVWSTTMS